MATCLPGPRRTRLASITAEVRDGEDLCVGFAGPSITGGDVGAMEEL